jgi:N-hydroxyarylamine O-acetyltransferase
MISKLNQQRTAAYLERLGVRRQQVTTDLSGLTLLHERHLRMIPFENLSIHLGEPIVLDYDALVDKLTVRRRGGFCYELNGAFAALLTTLGFDVSLYEARVGPDGNGMRFDHLCLRVRLPSGDRLADVGFGASFLRPLDLGTSAPQADPAGSYHIAAVGDEVPRRGSAEAPARVSPDAEFDMVENGEVQFRFVTTPRQLADFTDACHYHQTSPQSHFTRGTVCSLATADGRVTISDRKLITTTDGTRTEHVTASDDDLLDLYRRHFGITLDRVPVPAAAR